MFAVQLAPGVHRPCDTEAIRRPRRRARHAAVTLGLLVIVNSNKAVAQTAPGAGVSASTGYTFTGRPGLGLTASFYSRWWMLFAKASLNTTFIRTSSDPNTRYRNEVDSVGRSICRDTDNGQFSKRENCSGGGEFITAGMLSANLVVSDAIPVHLGGGYRFGSSAGPYAAVGYHVNFGEPFVFARIAGGRQFFQAHIGIGVRMWSPPQAPQGGWDESTEDDENELTTEEWPEDLGAVLPRSTDPHRQI